MVIFMAETAVLLGVREAGLVGRIRPLPATGSHYREDAFFLSENLEKSKITTSVIL